MNTYFLNIKNLFIFFVILMILFNFYLSNYYLVFRIILKVIISFFLFYWLKISSLGKKIIFFFIKSKLEVFKIIWPSINDAYKNVIIVCFSSLLISFIVWIIDKIIWYFIHFIY